MPKFAKGSKEAKDYMASLRAKRGAVKGKGMRRPPAPEPAPAHNNPLAQPHYWNGVEWVPVPQQAPMVALEDDDIIEGEGAFTKIFLDTATKVGTKAGEPFKNTVGVNPFTLGFDLGEKVIAPALMKRFPPKGRKGMRGGELPPAEHRGPANRDLTPEMTGSGMEYCPCSHCGGMGLKKKTRM